MARQKAYNEEEVIEKATELFWRKGYEATSMRALENTMGINKFSIYASFGSKQNVFLESLKCYRNKLNQLTDRLKTSDKGVDAIKDYFYDFLEFSKFNNYHKGCLYVNTLNEFGSNGDAIIIEEIQNYGNYIKSLFIEKLETDKSKSKTLVEKQANFLAIAMQGLSNASKIAQPKEMEDFIELTFTRI